MQHILEWSLPLTSWLWLGWLLFALVVGAAVIARDEWRLRRSRPARDEIEAYADRLAAQDGPDAYATLGRVMRERRHTTGLRKRRFLNEVAKELVGRLVQADPARDDSREDVQKAG